MNISKLYTDLDPSLNMAWDNDITVTKGARAVKNSILGIVTTRKGTRVFNPDFGCDLTDSLFENMTPLTAETVRKNIVNAIRNYEPRIYNLSVEATGNYDNNELIVTIKFSIVDNPSILEEIKFKLSSC